MRTALYHRSQHLRNSDLHAPTACCPICSSGLEREFVAFVQRDPDVSLLRCKSCFGCSASRMPTCEALDNYYASYYDSRPGENRATLDGPERFGRHIARRIGRHNGPLSIIDFGGGDGTLAIAVAEQMPMAPSVEITVIDYNENPAEVSDPRITISLRSPHLAYSYEASADVVIASAVLEHIPDLKTQFRVLAGALVPGGVLYVRTPAMAPFLRLANTLRLGLDFTFPAHLHDLGQAFWEKSLSLLDNPDEFEIVESRPSLVETELRKHPFPAIAASMLKAPWWLLRSAYPFIGGWEVFIRRLPDS